MNTKKVCSLYIGEKFRLNGQNCIRLPEMVINGHEAAFVVNYMVEGHAEQWGTARHTIDFVSPQTEVEVFI